MQIASGDNLHRERYSASANRTEDLEEAPRDGDDNASPRTISRSECKSVCVSCENKTVDYQVWVGGGSFNAEKRKNSCAASVTAQQQAVERGRKKEWQVPSLQAEFVKLIFIHLGKSGSVAWLRVSTYITSLVYYVSCVS